MTPDVQFSAQQMQSVNGMSCRLQSPLSDIIPPPEVHQAPNSVESVNNMMSHQQPQQQQQQHLFQHHQLEHMQQQMTPHLQQQLFMSNHANIMGTNFDMMSPQQQQLQQQMRINQMRQQVMNNQLLQQQQQQQQNQPQQMHMNQLRQLQFSQSMKPQSASEMQMLQNKLAAIYSAEAFDPRPIANPTVSGNASGSDHRNNSALHNNSNKKQTEDTTNMDNTLHADNRGKRGTSSRVEIPPGNNPRRMPPPSLLKRDDSLKMDKVFEAASPSGGETKKKYSDGIGSSDHLSAMSLSMGDLNDEGNLSQVFDTSLKISGGSSVQQNISNVSKIKNGASATSINSPTGNHNPQYSKVLASGMWGGGLENKNGYRSSNNHSWENANFEMSVATIGASEIGTSEVGNMSYATLNMPDHDGQLSFTGVFDEAGK